MIPNKTSILIIGGSGGTGHVAIQMARYCWNAKYVTTICSSKNVEFCINQGATNVITYDTTHDIIKELKDTPGAPYDIIMDCVTSDDIRDQIHSYPIILQSSSSKELLLKPNYIYRRLGGGTIDWIRAGIERITGIQSIWNTQHEKLFWIKFPKSSNDLKQIYNWINNDDKLKPPIIELQNIYKFTKYDVENALKSLLSRRIRGKVVIEIIPQGDDTKND